VHTTPDYYACFIVIKMVKNWTVRDAILANDIYTSSNLKSREDFIDKATRERKKDLVWLCCSQTFLNGE